MHKQMKQVFEHYIRQIKLLKFYYTFLRDPILAPMPKIAAHDLQTGCGNPAVIVIPEPKPSGKFTLNSRGGYFI